MRSVEERILVFLLRFGGGMMLLAWLAVLLPTEWMVWTNRRLGLGEFPDTALVQYLTRSVSALYGIHGGLLLALSFDVRRFAPVIAYMASMNVLFGVVVLGIDLFVGMPLWWTALEGPPVAAFGVGMWILLRRLPGS